jgi:uridine kinase
MLDVDAAVALLRSRPDLRFVAIDGLPVSGKSTLAERLELELQASILSLDDFVRPEAEWRNLVGPAFPFPYMRYDAFQHAVATLARGGIARFRRYVWSIKALADGYHELAPGPLTVVEGVSALHPELAPLYDLRIWVESDAATTLQASLARGVGDWEQEWRQLFMPSVELYLATSPQERADCRVRGRGITSA